MMEMSKLLRRGDLRLFTDNSIASCVKEVGRRTEEA